MRRTPWTVLLAAVLAVAPLTACTSHDYKPLDDSGVKAALLTDAEVGDGWSGMGETEQTGKTSVDVDTIFGDATGVPQACKDALRALSTADQGQLAGASVSYTDSPDVMDETQYLEMAARGFDHPPASPTQVGAVAKACTGSYARGKHGAAGRMEVSAPSYDVDGVSAVAMTLRSPGASGDAGATASPAPAGAGETQPADPAATDATDGADTSDGADTLDDAPQADPPELAAQIVAVGRGNDLLLVSAIGPDQDTLTATLKDVLPKAVAKLEKAAS